METLQAIAERRMIRPSRMSDAPVPRGMIEALIEAANWAPSHRQTEPWRFVVLQGEALSWMGEVFLEALLEAKPDANGQTRKKVAAKPLRSPVLIAVICSPSSKAKVKVQEEEWAVACAVQNMGLAARAIGLSVFWSTGTPAGHPLVAQAMGCTGDDRLMGMLHVGFPGEDGWPSGRRGAWEEKVQWVDQVAPTVAAWSND